VRSCRAGRTVETIIITGNQIHKFDSALLNSLHMNYIRDQTRRQKILNCMVASIPRIQPFLKFNVNAILTFSCYSKYCSLNFATFSKDLLTTFK
jgi:hypothetical protein